jgi:hypothetical protein
MGHAIRHRLKQVGGQIGSKIKSAGVNAGRHHMETKSTWKAKHKLAFDALAPFDDFEFCRNRCAIC